MSISYWEPDDNGILAEERDPDNVPVGLFVNIEEVDAILKEFNNQWISHENEICQHVIMKMQHLMREIERINDKGSES